MVARINLRKINIEAITCNHESKIKYITDHIREADAKELIAMTGSCDVFKMINDSVDVADLSFIATTEDGIPLCVFGLSNVETSHGRAIWLIGSKELDGFSKEFLVYSMAILQKWVGEYGNLYNFIHVENKKSARWLKSVGAKFSKKSILVNGEYFRLFSIGRKGE